MADTILSNNPAAPADAEAHSGFVERRRQAQLYTPERRRSPFLYPVAGGEPTLELCSPFSAKAIPQVTVSIVSHGQAQMSVRLIEDLLRHAAGEVAKLILTINVPEKVPPLGPLPFPLEIICNKSPKGFGANHNQAFGRSHSPYFAVLNPDLNFDVNPFPELIARLRDPQTGIVAPRVLDPDGAIADSARTLVTPGQVILRRFERYRRNIPRTSIEASPDWIAGMFLVFRRETFDALGGFDPRFFLYCEDVDICARARLRGLQIKVVPERSVTHYAQRASHHSVHRFRLHLASLLRLWTSPTYRDYRSLLRTRAP